MIQTFTRAPCNCNSRRKRVEKNLIMSLLLIFSSFAIIIQASFLLPTTSETLPPPSLTVDPSQASQNSSTPANREQFKLNCQPGEQRQFSYESSTKVWGSSDQQVRLRAILRLKCMEPPTNTTLKYLAEIVTLVPNFINQNEQDSQNKMQMQSKKNLAHKARAATLARSGNWVASQLTFNTTTKSSFRSQVALREAEIDQMLRTEPLLEEVSEAANRMGRSVSGWFSKAWGSVKDFFVNIFNSSERSTVSREQVLKESGYLDIAGQCKASSPGKGKNAVGLPFDESVFEDLGPEYYIGASLDGAATAYEFGETGHASTLDSSYQSQDDQQENEMDELMSGLSFFDDPLPRRGGSNIGEKQARAKRAAGGSKKSRSIPESSDHSKLIKLPFVFMQSKAGKIIELRFSGDETDSSVKNFKRHLCDLFATNLDWNKTTQNEVSPIGKHQTKYILDSSANSIDSLKQSLLQSSSSSNDSEERSNEQQLVRVLAAIGGSDRRFLKESDGNHQTLQPDDSTGTGGGGYDDDHADEQDQKAASGGGRQPIKSISVLRSINTTNNIQLSSKMLSPDFDKIQVRIKQVQQIDDGRIVGTAGQLSMSLQQIQQQSQQSSMRNKRDANGSATATFPTTNNDPLLEEQVSDIADFLKVSTSFSLQLIPIPRDADGAIDDEDSLAQDETKRSRRSTKEAERPIQKLSSTNKLNSTKTKLSMGNGNGKQSKRVKKSAAQLVKLPPSDLQELQRILQEWRKQEARLQLSATNLIAENSSQQESRLLRLDILRDQIRQRLNEEFVRNRLRRSLNQQQMALASNSADGKANGDWRSANGAEKVSPPSQAAAASRGDFGLGFTQLVLGNGVTTKRKGSIYSTIDEVLELEANLADEYNDQAISKLLRETIRMDKLKQHCKSSLPNLEQLSREVSGAGRRRSSNIEIERRMPFGITTSGAEENSEVSGDGPHRKASSDFKVDKQSAGTRQARADKFERQNDRKLEQCKQVLQLLLKVSDRQAIDLVIEMIDECNQNLLAAAKQEELGYGPLSKFYRRLRQQLIELLTHLSKPTDALLDKLMSRLYYPKMDRTDTGGGHSVRKQQQQSRLPTRSSAPTPEPEFVYVSQRASDHQTKYNKSLLKEEDDSNNSDGAALLVMTLTSLAAKSSVSRSKRVEVSEKLLQSLKGTSCSLFNSPDLDIIESMANFQEPLNEIVGRILQLARKCKQHDQYTVASIHGLSGQLQHLATQRFFSDLLKSKNVSCTVKSEIVLTLIGAQLINDLKQIPVNGGASSSFLDDPNLTVSSVSLWPSVGQNEVDEALLDLVDNSDRSREPDRRCLEQLVGHYISKKHNQFGSSVSPPSVSSGGKQNAGSKLERSSRSHSQQTSRTRHKRTESNAQGFWDDAHCKRWTMPADGSGQIDLGSIFPFGSGNQTHLLNSPSSNTDLIDEIDDNSIITALANNQRVHSARAARRSQKLIERELEGGNGTATSSVVPLHHQTSSGQQSGGSPSFLRKRHKCVASKNFGPKNAQASIKAEVVNDLIGNRDENKFLARFRLSTNFLGNRIDVGRMYLWHQRRTTRAYANILGRNVWDSSHGCKDKAPSQVLYTPLFDFNLWLVKVSVGLRLNAEMGFYPNCESQSNLSNNKTELSDHLSRLEAMAASDTFSARNDELQLYPTIGLRAAGEATAKLIVARVGMSLASHYGYQGDIRVSRQPDSCMSIYSSHQPMNITFSSWFQLWDNDCHYWGSRSRAEPRAIRWRLTGLKPTAWVEDECMSGGVRGKIFNSTSDKSLNVNSTSARSTLASGVLATQINP